MGVRDAWDSYELYDGESVLQKVFSVDLGENQTITTRVCPLFVKVDETGNWYPTGSPSQVNSDLYAAWFIVQVGLEPTGTTTILRLESNTKGITLESCIDFVCSGVPQGDFDFLFKCHPAHQTSWDDSGTPTNIKGWLKVRIATADRWIALYETSP